MILLLFCNLCLSFNKMYPVQFNSLLLNYHSVNSLVLNFLIIFSLNFSDSICTLIFHTSTNHLSPPTKMLILLTSTIPLVLPPS